MATIARVRKDFSRRVLEPLIGMGQIFLEEGVSRISAQTGWSEASIHQDFLADRQQRPARRNSGTGRSPQRDEPPFDPGPDFEDPGGGTVVIMGDMDPGAVASPPLSSSPQADQKSLGTAAILAPEEEQTILKMAIRDVSYYRPLFRIFPPERWRSPVHRELALRICEERGVPDVDEVSDSGQKSLLIDINSTISKVDEMLSDPDERNLLVPQYMAEIVVTELERKRTQLVRKGDVGPGIQSINDQIQTLTSSKFLFDNPSQVDEIINTFELEPAGSVLTQKSEEQERTIHE